LGVEPPTSSTAEPLTIALSLLAQRRGEFDPKYAIKPVKDRQQQDSALARSIVHENPVSGNLKITDRRPELVSLYRLVVDGLVLVFADDIEVH
jgi:hypothetical protein